MNIWAKSGDKVVYLDEGGYKGDTEYVRKQGFVKGQVYNVAYTVVHSSSTDVYFTDISGCYNSVMFEDYVEAEHTPDENDPVIVYNDARDKTFEVDVQSTFYGLSATVTAHDGNLQIANKIGDIKINIPKEVVIELLGLVEKPRMEIVQEKVFAGEEVFYQLDVPAWRELDNVWYTRKHAVKVTPTNWSDYKNGSPDKFLF
jgi:hypothetical protein